jgi:hypothetical protein
MNRLFKVKFKDEITNLRKTGAGVSQGSVLGPILCLICKSELPTSDNTITATFADDTAFLATHEDLGITSMKLQTIINKIKINQSKSMHITFTLRNQTCPTVQMGSVDLPQKNEVKYLGMQLDRKLTRAKHIKTKRKQLNLEATEMHWLLGRR